MNTELATAFANQIRYCDQNDAPFTARVVEAAWQDWQDGGALREVMPDWPGDPRADALPLRVAGALHALALSGRDPALAALYPPRGKAFDATTGPAVVRAALARFRDHVAFYLASPPQTNEIGRSAVLLGGFAVITQQTRLPLILCEIGASAGLNTLWDRFHYDLGPLAWGDAASPVHIRARWEGTPATLPHPPAHIAVAARCACDLAPIDVRAEGAALRLESYVWPEHTDRLARLRAAIALASTLPTTPEAIDAASFAARVLAAPRPGHVTVLYHTIVWQYFDAQTRAAIRQSFADAGARATADAPVAHLSFEVRAPQRWPELSLRLWPGGERRVLAEAHHHGSVVRWGVPPPD